MREIDDAIKNSSYQPVYLFYGEETYLIRQYRDKLLQALVAEDDNMNFSSYEGKGINTKEIIDLAETLPFFAEHRVILMENTNFFKEACDDLAAYIKEMSAETTTVFLFLEENVDKRSKMYKAVKAKGACIEFGRQTDKILMQWILTRLKREKRKITTGVMQLFLSKTGNDMERIDKELEKLLCYTMGKEIIEAEDVETICVGQVTNQIFDMVNAISAKDKRTALHLYYDLLALKEPPMRILFLITRQFHILYQMKSGMNAGLGQSELASICKIPSFAVRKHQAQAKSFSLQELKKAFSDGIQMEEDVKTGKINDQLAVEWMIIRYTAS